MKKGINLFSILFLLFSVFSLPAEAAETSLTKDSSVRESVSKTTDSSKGSTPEVLTSSKETTPTAPSSSEESVPKGSDSSKGDEATKLGVSATARNGTAVLSQHWLLLTF